MIRAKTWTTLMKHDCSEIPKTKKRNRPRKETSENMKGKKGNSTNVQ